MGRHEGEEEAGVAQPRAGGLRHGPSSRSEEWRPCVLAQLASVTTTEAGDAESGEMYTDYSATHATAKGLSIYYVSIFIDLHRVE